MILTLTQTSMENIFQENEFSQKIFPNGVFRFICDFTINLYFSRIC